MILAFVFCQVFSTRGTTGSLLMWSLVITAINGSTPPQESSLRCQQGAQPRTLPVSAAAQDRPAPTAVHTTGLSIGPRRAQATGREAEPKLPVCAVSLQM